MKKIGEFSKLVGIPAKTLRYYDELGLFSPETVDSETGYRFYHDSQIPRLNKILFYRQLGFSLTIIKQILDDGINDETIRGMLRQRKSAIQKILDDEKARLDQIELTIEEINEALEAQPKENKIPIIIKKIDEVQVVSMRGFAPGIANTGKWLGKASQKVIRFIIKNNAQMNAPGIALYHSFSEDKIDIEFAQPFRGTLESMGNLVVKTLPGIEQAVCVYHFGPLNKVDYAHQVLLTYIKTNGLQINGAVRDVYLKYDPRGNPKDYITEIQYPII